MDEMPNFDPVEVKCSDTDCENDLHCYRPKRWAKDKRTNVCQSCGDSGVDWDVLHDRDLTHVDVMFDQLQRELIRHVFFTAPLDEKARKNIEKIGVDKTREGVRAHLQKKIAIVDKIFRDGMQTPKRDRVVHFAQHATATCCRSCLDYWYGIPRNRDLTDEELSFCEGLVHAYMDLRKDEISAAEGMKEKSDSPVGKDQPNSAKVELSKPGPAS